MENQPMDLAGTFEAIKYVESLPTSLIQADVPCMQAANSAIKYEVNYDTNNEDNKGFRLVQANYKEEADLLGDFHNILKQGDEYVITLYTWRSCSRAFPTTTRNDVELTNAIQEKTIEIMKPMIDKMKEYKKFLDDAMHRLVDEISKLSSRRKREEYVSEAYMLTMCRMVKMFALVDEMKNMKASMKNDNTQFRRAKQYFTMDLQDDTEYSMYLATRNLIRQTLKENLLKVDKFEEFFVDLVNFCVTMYTERLYIFPEEKHNFVLVMAFSLYIMDTEEGAKIININKIKKLPLSKIDQIFKECEVVNVFGDMSVNPFSFVESTPHFDRSKWPECTSSKTSTQGSIMTHITQFRSEYTALTSELARYSNANIFNPSEDINENLKPAYDIALKSLQLLSKWTTQIIDTFSWKLSHLADPFQDSTIPSTAEDYERATRYNYSSDEKFALIELIAMIKTVQNQLTRFDNHFTDTTIPHMYAELQRFLHLTLPEIYHKCQKSKSASKSKSSFYIKTIWAVGLDMNATKIESEVLKKYKTLSGKKNAAQLEQYLSKCRDDMVPRKVPPGSTQLYLIRCIIETLYSDRTKNPYRKELDKDSLQALADFHRCSFYWSYMLNYSENLTICCDLSQLWYREFFLEMTNGSRIQFPIETSLPCILTNHILDTQHPAYIEYLLYPLDLYNDTAICALKTFRRQFLYNEIEAEVNFMMIQLIVRLSEQIFVYYKQCASLQIMNKRYANQLRAWTKREVSGPAAPGRYATLMKQRHLLLLGQSFNLSKLISQNINTAIYQSLETAVKRLQKTGIVNIVEFFYLLEVNRLCHQLLSEHLDLDNFDSMLTEITQSTTSKFGTVTSFVISEITDVICVNYAFNSVTERFVTIEEIVAKKKLSHELHTSDRPEYLWGSKSLNSHFDQIFKLYHGFFGKEHLVKIVELIGYDGVFALLRQITEVAFNTLTTEIQHYVSYLINILPTNLSSRLEGKSSPDQIKIILSDLNALLAVNNINTEVAQALRKFGNFIIIILKLENCMFIQEGLEMKQAHPFIEQFPKVYGTAKMNPEEKEREYEKLRNKYQVYNIRKMMDILGTPEQFEISKHQIDLTKERLCQDFSIFKKFLISLQTKLTEMVAKDNNDSMVNFWTRKAYNFSEICGDHQEKAFYMVWSAIMFVFASPKPDITNFDGIYGEGLYWTGATIIGLMAQQRMFETYNVCTKLYRSYTFSRKEFKMDASLEPVVTRIGGILAIHNRLFDIINRYMGISDTYNHSKGVVIHLDPDIDSDDSESDYEDYD